MSNVIPFESGKLPSFVRAANAAALNEDLAVHAGTGFPVMSIKGKTFTMVRNGERELLMNPKDPDSPATSIEVVLVKASPNKAKQFYLKGWQEGQEAEAPDCWSNDGVRPDASVDPEKRQHTNCAACRHNQWGTKIGDKGATKGKACQDSVRVAIASPARINDPFLLRVPPASIKPLGEYGEQLKKRGVGYNMVVTKISFDMEAPTPKLVFKPVGFVDEAAWNEIQEVVAGDVVKKIMGIVNTEALPAPEAPAPAPTPRAAAPAPAPAPAKPKAQQFFAAAPDPAEPEEGEAPVKSKKVTEDEVVAAVGKPTSAGEVVVDMADLDLSSLNFDD